MNGTGIYAQPVLGRYGLTHGLLAWARCRLWCEQTGATMLAPNWFKLRIGPYLRRERDKRNYFLLFHAGHALSGWRRAIILSRSRTFDVGAEWPAIPASEPRSIILRFHNALKDNEKKSFAQISGHGAFLRKELLAITRRRYHPAAVASPFVAIHVRLGDFSVAAPGAPAAAGATNMRLPIDWYGDRLIALRQALGQDVAAIVFSDGSQTELASLLELPNVVRAGKQQSVTDLLQLGQGIALIASGSGFSLWGAFLGSVPRISYPGQSIVPCGENPASDIESGLGEAISASFVEQVQARLSPFA